MERQERSFEMARRLKALRNSKGLSHNDLKNELQHKYKIQISRASLLNYEIDDEFHSKADVLANLKMNAEYLNCFADFYGVSTDYLLCRTDIKTPNMKIRTICDYTSLSEETIDVLLDSTSLSSALNVLVQYRSFRYLLLAVTQYKKMLTAASIYRNVPNTCEDDSSRSTEVLSYVYEQNMAADIRYAVDVYDHSVSMLKTLREGQRELSDGEFGSTINDVIAPADIYELNANRNFMLLLEEIASDAELQGLILTGEVK